MSLSSPEPPHGDADLTPEEAPPPRNAKNQSLAALRPLDVVPPHDVELERELLGAMMFTAENDAAIVAAVSAVDFYGPAHRLVFDAILALRRRGVTASGLLLEDELRRRGHLDAVGGRQGVVAIELANVICGDAPYLAERVKSYADARAVIDEARTLEAIARSSVDDLSAALTPTRERLATLGSPQGPAADAEAATVAAAVGPRLRKGGGFLLDVPETPPALWGREGQVLWARDESLIVCGPAGVGKTTLCAQLTMARIGLRADVLGYPAESGSGRVLYLALDRPAQIRRALGRLVTEADREVLDERLVAWAGPPPKDLAAMPELLVHLAREAGADTVVLDSLKDAAIGLSDDSVGAGVNRAMQACVSEGIQVLALHHQRKGVGGAKPKTLEDLYGSTWIAAGAGSVLLLWGQAGDPVVELVHLKQPAEEVGPLKVEHDHVAGVSTVTRGFDTLRYLTLRPGGATTIDVARAMFERTDPTDAQRAKARRQLDRLVREGLTATPGGGTSGGAGGTPGTVYVAVDRARQEQAG